MSLQRDRTESDNLTFHRDKNASKSTHKVHGKVQNLDKYFDFLDELKPSLNEIRKVTVYKEPFNLRE